MSLRKAEFIAVSGLIAIALLAGTACKSKSARESVAENRIERTLEKASGGKVDLNLRDGTLKVKTPEGESVLTTGERKWPEDLPEGIIKFENAKVQAVSRAATEEGKTWTIHVTDVGEGALSAYEKKLKEEGWNIMASTYLGTGGSVHANKNDLLVNIMLVDEQKSGVISFLRQAEK